MSDGLDTMVEERHAVFVEPEGAARAAVVDWKARIARQFPGSAYLHHPPHGTLWVGHVSRADDALAALRRAVAAVPAVAGFACRPHVFYDDAMAGGGQTCAFAAPLTSDLAALQHAVSEALVPYCAVPALVDVPAPLRHEPFVSSVRRYGFPFVGAHWIPHFTVASLLIPRDAALIHEFLEEGPQPSDSIQYVSWWRIVGDDHERGERMSLLS